MNAVEQLQELWRILVALPGQVWLSAFYLFVIVGVLKSVGVVRDGNYAAASNAVIAIAMNGGFSGLDELSVVLQASGTAVIGAVYYLLWSKYVGSFLGDLVGGIKAKLPSKG